MAIKQWSRSQKAESESESEAEAIKPPFSLQGHWAIKPDQSWPIPWSRPYPFHLSLWPRKT